MSGRRDDREQAHEREERERELVHRLVEELQPRPRRPARAVPLGEADLQELGDRRVEDVDDGQLERADAVDREGRGGHGARDRVLVELLLRDDEQEGAPNGSA